MQASEMSVLKPLIEIFRNDGIMNVLGIYNQNDRLKQYCQGSTGDPGKSKSGQTTKPTNVLLVKVLIL